MSEKFGPLGPGHEPVKDPMKGLRGVMAGTLVMEAISIWLVLTVILKVDGGAHWTPLNWGYVTAVGAAMFLWAFMQKRPFALPVNLALQVLAVLGFFVHPSMGIMGLIFVVVWGYILVLRKNLIERMRRGLLTTQHT